MDPVVYDPFVYIVSTCFGNVFIIKHGEIDCSITNIYLQVAQEFMGVSNNWALIGGVFMESINSASQIYISSSTGIYGCLEKLSFNWRRFRGIHKLGITNIYLQVTQEFMGALKNWALIGGVFVEPIVSAKLWQWEYPVGCCSCAWWTTSPYAR